MSNTEKATFAAGCFWGVESTFKQLDGVISTKVGYTGGVQKNPTYKQVCTDMTGHAEAIEIIYDPSKISYEKLLKHFWTMHNPTTVNRQGPDIGSQYRSAVFYHNTEQMELAEKVREELNNTKYAGKIVTEITPATVFWDAEEYHQNYYEKNGIAPACGY